MNIEIMNMRQFVPVYPSDVRADRFSVLGNPHKMSNESERNRVCELYNDGFEELCRVDEGVQKELARLKALLKEYGQLRLFCWCFPKRCHIETIRRYLLQGKGQDR